MTSKLLPAALTLMMATMAVPAYAGEEAIVVNGASPLPTPARVEAKLSRPAILPALYATYAGLQAYDIYSTRQALSRGAREANPLMQGVAGDTGMMTAVKASATIGTIVAAERLWRSNKKAAAIAMLVASNGVAAIVAARNARTLRSLR